MPLHTLTYGVFHLGLYMASALAWMTLCIVLLRYARRRTPGVSNAGCLGAGATGALICLSFLLADVLRLVDERVVLFGLLLMGVIAPGLVAAALYVRLSWRRETVC